MDQSPTNQGYMYQIRLKEALDRSATDWFGEITITAQENGETLLSGQFADQPALRGFMNQLWNLNFTILSLERIGKERPKTLENRP